MIGGARIKIISETALDIFAENRYPNSSANTYYGMATNVSGLRLRSNWQ
jgi:hypothetical protein